MMLGRLLCSSSWEGQATGVAGTSLAPSQAEVASVAYSLRTEETKMTLPGEIDIVRLFTGRAQHMDEHPADVLSPLSISVLRGFMHRGESHEFICLRNRQGILGVHC